MSEKNQVAALRALHLLICDLFSDSSFLQHIKLRTDGAHLIKELPTGVGIATLASKYIDLAERHNLLNAELFAGLKAEFPGRKHQIEQVARLVFGPAEIGVPRRPFGYIERPDLTRRLEDAMQKGGAVLVGLHGAGGVGKTVLAAEFVRVHAAEFSVTAWVDVRNGDGSSVVVAQSLLPALGFPQALAPDLLTSMRALSQALEEIAATGKSALLILDNADHPDTQFFQFVSHLATAPGAVVLVTTRSRTIAHQIDGDPIDVGRFTVNESIDCLRHWLERTPERARDTAGLRQIAIRLGEFPLAIKLAGAYLRRHHQVSLAEYDGQLATLELAGESLTNSLEISLRVLSQGERSLFTAAGACAPESFTPAAAAAAAVVDEVLAREGLRHLYELSLVERWNDDRFTLHPLLREFVQKDQEFINFASRHADWVVSIIGDDVENIEKVAAIVDELQTAAEFMEHRDAQRLVGLCAVAGEYWLARGPWDLASRLLKSAAEAMSLAGPDNQDKFHVMLLMRADVLHGCGDWDEALDVLAVLTSESSTSNDSARSALALYLTGDIFMRRSRLAEARTMLERAFRHCRRCDDKRRIESRLANAMGLLEHESENYIDALNWYRRARKIERKLPGRNDSGVLLTNMGNAYADLRHFSEAMALYNEALAIQRHRGVPMEIAMTQNSRGNVFFAQRELSLAEECYEESLRLAQQMGNASWIGENFYSLSIMRFFQSRYEEAGPLAEEALRLLEGTGEPARVVTLRTILARIAGRISDEGVVDGEDAKSLGP